MRRKLCLYTKTNKNYITIVAVLGVLPASKNAVTMILFLKAKQGKRENYQKIRCYEDKLAPLYNLVLTTYEKNYRVDAICVVDNILYGFTEVETKEKEIVQDYFHKMENHITDMMLQNKLEVTVMMYDHLEEYLAQLDKLMKIDVNDIRVEQTRKIKAVLLAISI